MDEIDFFISLMLMGNSRKPYREFAETFKMSVNSIHKRIKSLVDLGIIQNFQTRLGFNYFPSRVNVVMFGTSKIKDKKVVIEKLGKHECIYNVTQASGNLFYIHSHIRNLNELDSLVLYIRRIGGIDELTIGLHKGFSTKNHENLGYTSLSKLDYLIVNSLKDNSRKTISDIADEVGSTTKTVRRHLNRLEEKGFIQFTIDWYPDKTGEILSMIILNLDPNANSDTNIITDELQKKYGQKILFSWAFSNLPNLMLLNVWTRSMKELQELETSLLAGNFSSVNVTVLIEGKMFHTWNEKYLENKIKEVKDGSD